jgi:hypothetical protein
MAAKVEPPPSRPLRLATLHDLPDKLPWRILQLLIDSPLWIVRAAATCRQWRRLIAHWSFRSTMGYRQDQPPAGSYHNTRNRRGPVFVPSSPDDVDGRHFSLDFLPGGSGAWELVDSHCNMLLLAKWKTGWRRHCFPDLLVCEPLKRRYQLIPPMDEVKRHRCVGVFLYGCSSVDNGAHWGRNGARIPNFKLVCLLYQEHHGVRDDKDRAVGIGTVVACVFDRFKACDRVLVYRKPGWCLRRKERLLVHLHGAESLRLLGRSGSSVFWGIKEDEESLLCLSSDGYIQIAWLPEIARRSTALRFIDHGSEPATIQISALLLQCSSPGKNLRG